MKLYLNLYVENRYLVPVYFIEKEERKREERRKKNKKIKERSMYQMVV